MKYTLLYERSAFCLPGSALDASKKASLNDMRVLLSLGSGSFSEEKEIASFLGLSLPNVEKSLEFWRGAGVVCQKDDEVPESTENASEKGAPNQNFIKNDVGRDAYTSEQISSICKNDKTVKPLIEACEEILGKQFTKTEITSVVYLYDHLRLDGEYIMMLCTYCKSIEKPSIRYVEKTAISLYDAGVDTVKSLDIYIRDEERKKDGEYKIRKLFGIGERALTPKEKSILDKWIKEWDIPFELIEKGYEVMMGAVERPTFAYENGILEKWRESGIKTLSEAEEMLSLHKQNSANKAGAKKAADKKNAENTSFDLDEFFELAVKRGAGRADGIKTEK